MHNSKAARKAVSAISAGELEKSKSCVLNFQTVEHISSLWILKPFFLILHSD